MKRHSIRFKFFAAISAVALVFIGVLILLNLFFYDDYYMLTRRAGLRDAYHSVRRSYTGDLEGLAPVLDALENRNAIRLAVVSADGTLLYSSSFFADNDPLPTNPPTGFASPQDRYFHPGFGLYDQQLRGVAVLSAVIKTADWEILRRNNYQFLNVSLHDSDQYLCLAGLLDSRASACLIAYTPYALIRQNSTFNLTFLLIAGGCSLLICLVLGYWVSRQFTRPLIAMAGVADRMSELDFSTKYDGRGRHADDELGRLGQSLNRLSSYLEQAVGELQRSNEQLAQEVREKERIDNMRREFIINVSHELKTPISLIQGYAEGLTAGVADDPEDRRFYCDTIVDEARHMNQLVMQLLNLSKLELGAEQIYFEDVDLCALCQTAVQKTAVLCASRQLKVRCETDCVTVRTDCGLIEQVLMNYLSNAIRYTADGGCILLSAAPIDGGARLSVFNEGHGLPQAELSKVWEKFYRTDFARTREDGGTGIGLSLVRAIAGILHGRCGANNVEGGIIFWFDIINQPDVSAAD